ncbi:hypothetical protein ACFLSI_01575 [Bacteroidota bacterium]
MSKKKNIQNILIVAWKLIRYNLKIIFANKFLYFFLAAVMFFILVTLINLFSGSNPTEGSVYYLLFVPGFLLVFYPTTYGIQNDLDSRMLEIIFGIPNYRYKVWLLRLIQIYIIVSINLLFLCFLSSLAIVRIPVFEMVYQLMFPIFMIGSLSFMFSTVIKSGNGAGVVVIIILTFLFILADPLQESKFNIYLNPFEIPREVNETIWKMTSFYNRLILIIISILANLIGLYNLQKREKFV